MAWLLKSIQTGIERRHEFLRNDKPTTSRESKNSTPTGYLTKANPAFEVAVSLFEQHTVEDYMSNLEQSLRREFYWKPVKVYVAVFALKEVVDNAFEHGCKGKGELEVSICFRLESNGKRLVFRVKSPGSGFDLSNVLEKAKSLKLNVERGRGLLFVKQISDRLISSSDGLLIQAIILSVHQILSLAQPNSFSRMIILLLFSL